MTLLSVVISYLILRWWGAARPLQRDTWFYRWCEWLDRQPKLSEMPLSVFVLAIFGPVFLLLLVLIAVSSLWYWLQLLVAVPVLLYSVGRGKYSAHIQRYLRARQERDWIQAVASYQALATPEQTELDLLDQEDWPELDQRMLTTISYRGFERTFAVLFWFVLLGPVGALAYRLTALYIPMELRQSQAQAYAQGLLWLLEWPASRLLGLSFALTGNFVGCIQSWSNQIARNDQSSAELLVQSVRGALQVDETTPASPTIAEREYQATLSLYSRTLIFWLCVLALITVLT